MRFFCLWHAPVRSFGLLVPVLALAGCTAFGPSATPVATPAATISGSLHGGQQPVAGATISLVAPGTTGYGVAGSVIVSTTTDSLGRFTIPRPYTCPTNNGLTYILATGGDAGAGNNPALAEAVILGPCSTLTESTFVNITEVTTAAAAYVLAPFASTTSATAVIGTSATNLQGLANAVGTSNNLANSGSGLARTTANLTGIVPPTAELNTIADILSACVNQGTSTATNGACATLFSATTPAGGTAPTDTFQAAINIALHPAASVPALFGLATANAPFQPTLSAAPADFTVALGFNGGAITTGGGTIAVAIDASGNAWITTGYFDAGTHSVTEISPAGAYFSGSAVAASSGFGSSVLTNPTGVAIDQNGFVLVTNYGQNNVLKFNSNGTVQATLTASSLNQPNGIAIDAAGNSWIANAGNGGAITRLTAAGAEASNSPLLGSQGGEDIAIDSLAVWESSYGGAANGGNTRIDLSSFAITTSATGQTTQGFAIDHANNPWYINTSNGLIVHSSNSGSVLGSYSPSGSVFPQNLAIDGLGNVFSGTFRNQSSAGTLVEYSNAGTLLSPSNGFMASGVMPVKPLAPNGIAVDGSGNVWVTGTNNTSSLPNYVTQIVGIAAPVVTPLSVAVTNNTLGTRP